MYGLLPPTSTTSFISFLSRYRMEASWTALLAYSTVAARSAASGHPALAPVSTLAAWTFAVPTSGQRPTPIRPSASRFVASPSSCRPNNLLHLFPFSLPYGGFVYRTAGVFGGRGSNGLFWTSGAYSGVFARSLNFSGASVWPERSDYKTNGFSVRCLAK